MLFEMPAYSMHVVLKVKESYRYEPEIIWEVFLYNFMVFYIYMNLFKLFLKIFALFFVTSLLL